MDEKFGIVGMHVWLCI